MVRDILRPYDKDEIGFAGAIRREILYGQEDPKVSPAGGQTVGLSHHFALQAECDREPSLRGVAGVRRSPRG